MDNPTTDYEDVSDDDFEIATASAARLVILHLDAPLPDLSSVFEAVPCSRTSDLRICDEAPGTHEFVDAPTFPVLVDGYGTLVLIEYDSDTMGLGTADRIAVVKDPAFDAALRLQLF